MLTLSIFWLLGGALLGGLANGARLGLRAWSGSGRRRALGTLMIGAVGALVFGWLGVLIWGRPFGNPTALWGCALSVAVVPWLITWVRSRPARR